MTSGFMRGLALSGVTALSISVAPFLASPATAAPGTLSLKATSSDGPAFDLDEYAAGDLTVQVTDSVAGGVDVDDAQDLSYFWTITPFDAAAPPVRVPATGEDVQTVDVDGDFVVPLPTTQTPGTYVLVAGLGADGTGAGAIPESTVLTVETGNAAITFDDADPLRTAAGTDHPVAGDLRLEDGTGLPGRLVDLDYTRGTAGSDLQPDAGLVPAVPGAPVTDLQVTTGADGAFEAVLSDPSEDPQGTELGGSLAADTATTPAIGDADADASLAVDLVSEQPPAGSTLVSADLGGGTPGRPLGGEVTLTAPDDTFDTDPTTPGVQGDPGTDPDPVQGQLVTLSLDHGFFTTGEESLPSVVGGPAGRLVQAVTTLTGVTDADGHVEYQVGIKRDVGFDDDGLVTATVTTHAGDLTALPRADWDSSDPLNGTTVQIALSPASQQVAPVDPAVAGNRTYYDVFTLDQFGNRVGGQPVDLGYSGDLDDYDYSNDFVVSDFDTSGDIWAVSFQPGAIDVTGTWNAPTDQYVDTTGDSVAGSTDVTGSATAAFYHPDFKASTFSIRSSPTKIAEVGTAVTQTVTVVDQLGNPVVGYRVQFFRSGPDHTSGEPKVTRTTNAVGQAGYTFVGTKVGAARISAQVTNGISTRTLSNVVYFRLPVTARLKAVGNGRAADSLTVKAGPAAAGARVVVFRVYAGHRHVVGGRRLDATGTALFTAQDRNFKRLTTYVAVVRGTTTTLTAESNTVTVR